MKVRFILMQWDGKAVMDSKGQPRVFKTVKAAMTYAMMHGITRYRVALKDEV